MKNYKDYMDNISIDGRLYGKIMDKVDISMRPQSKLKISRINPMYVLVASVCVIIGISSMIILSGGGNSNDMIALATERNLNQPDEPFTFSQLGPFFDTFENVQSSIDAVKWFDEAVDDVTQYDISRWKTYLPEFPNIEFVTNFNEVIANDIIDDRGKFLFKGMYLWSVYFADVTGDGLPDLCATISDEDVLDGYVLVYDYANSVTYTLNECGYYNYSFLLKDGKLIIRQLSNNVNANSTSNGVSYAEPFIIDGSLMGRSSSISSLEKTINYDYEETAAAGTSETEEPLQYETPQQNFFDIDSIIDMERLNSVGATITLKEVMTYGYYLDTFTKYHESDYNIGISRDTDVWVVRIVYPNAFERPDGVMIDKQETNLYSALTGKYYTHSIVGKGGDDSMLVSPAN